MNGERGVLDNKAEVRTKSHWRHHHWALCTLLQKMSQQHWYERSTGIHGNQWRRDANKYSSSILVNLTSNQMVYLSPLTTIIIIRLAPPSTGYWLYIINITSLNADHNEHLPPLRDATHMDWLPRHPARCPVHLVLRFISKQAKVTSAWGSTL